MCGRDVCKCGGVCARVWACVRSVCACGRAYACTCIAPLQSCAMRSVERVEKSFTPRQKAICKGGAPRVPADRSELLQRWWRGQRAERREGRDGEYKRLRTKSGMVSAGGILSFCSTTRRGMHHMSPPVSTVSVHNRSPPLSLQSSSQPPKFSNGP